MRLTYRDLIARTIIFQLFLTLFQPSVRRRVERNVVLHTMGHFKQLTLAVTRLLRATSYAFHERARIRCGRCSVRWTNFYLFVYSFFPSLLSFCFVFFRLNITVRNRGVSLDTHTYTLGEIGTRLFGHASCRNVYVIITATYPRVRRKDRHKELRIRIGARLSYYKNYACVCSHATLTSRARTPNAERLNCKECRLLFFFFFWSLVQRRY